MSFPDVVVLGDANPDIVLTGDVVPRFGQVEQLVEDGSLTLGGSAAIVACGLAKLGVSTALVSYVGRDHLGDLVRAWLEGAGVDTRWMRTHPDLSTGFSVILSRQDRAILTYPGTITALDSDAVAVDLISRARHVHAASYFLQPRLATGLCEILRIARANGATTSLDTNWDPIERWAGVQEILPEVDVLFPNAAELIAIAGTGGHPMDGAAWQCAVDALTKSATTVALKAGAAGGAVWTPAGDHVTRAGVAVDAVDTTGAGDSFDAGYIAAMIEGLSVENRLDYGVICGCLSTRLLGGTSAQPSRNELHAVLSTQA
jgi:sugar/nucleoside kinase (ribokinase family)